MLIMGKATHVGKGVDGKSQYFPVNHVVKSKLL